VWSPDDTSIVFGADTGELFTARTDGSAKALRLAAGLEPDWR
jgi:hypothetical protein